MSASNVECGATKGVSISLLSDHKVNLITMGGREYTLEVKHDVALLIAMSYVFLGGNTSQIRFRRGTEIPRKGKEFSTIGDVNVLRTRHLGSQQTYLPYALCINILLLRMYIDLLRATWVYIALYTLYMKNGLLYFANYTYCYAESLTI